MAILRAASKVTNVSGGGNLPFGTGHRFGSDCCRQVLEIPSGRRPNDRLSRDCPVAIAYSYQTRAEDLSRPGFNQIGDDRRDDRQQRFGMNCGPWEQ